MQPTPREKSEPSSFESHRYTSSIENVLSRHQEPVGSEQNKMPEIPELDLEIEKEREKEKEKPNPIVPQKLDVVYEADLFADKVKAKS